MSATLDYLAGKVTDALKSHDRSRAADFDAGYAVHYLVDALDHGDERPNPAWPPAVHETLARTR